MTKQTALQKAVARAGGQNALARKLTEDMGRKVSQAHVWNWLNKQDGTVPAEYAIPIERVVEGHVTRQQLRPDIYPDSHVA